MENYTFDELQEQLQRLYHDRHYTQALELARASRQRFPEQAPLLSFWSIAMAAETGDVLQALDYFKYALEQGFWYGDTLLRKSPALKPLQGQPEFERLVEWNRQRKEQDPEQSFSFLVLRSQGECQHGGDPCPLTLALHDNGQTASDSAEFWQPAARAGWLVGALQSSQAMWKGAYVWIDRQKALQEIEKHSQTLAQQYAVDLEQAILAGLGESVETILWSALNRRLPLLGLIALAPRGAWIEDLPAWEGLIQENPNLGLRAYWILAEEIGQSEWNDLQDLIGRLNQAGIACESERVPLAGQVLTPAYEASFLRALNFISARRA